jgi:site-specific DNA-methyltransferase (adenine-specific)
MNLIPIEKILVTPNRQRREFDATLLQELITSIQDNKAGLLHAPILRAVGNDRILVAGERRLRAVKDILELGGTYNYAGEPVPAGMIPYTLLTDLTELEAWEAELEENIRRTDLSWHERAQATSELMRLRGAQAVERGEPAPTTAALAEEVRGSSIGGAQDDTRKELIVARHLHDPDVAAAPNLREAFKVLKKKEESKKNSELAAVIGKTFTAAKHTLLNVDCLEWLAACPDASFEIILTDPPYGMGADEFGDSGVGTSAAAHFYKDDYETWATLMSALPQGLFRVAAPQAHAYLFCDFDRFPELRLRMQDSGWKVHRTPIIWHNPDGFRAPWPKQGPQRKYELILYAVKGDREVNMVAPDVILCRKDPKVGHPAQKPVPLLVELLRRSARPGDRVLDAFGGSGSTVEAGHQLKLTVTMLESDPAAYGIAVRRVQELGEMERVLL